VAATQGRSRLLKSGPARRLRPCDGRHKLSADIAHTRHAQHKKRHVVTLRYEARAEREARDTRTGLAAEPLVNLTVEAPRNERTRPVIRRGRCTAYIEINETGVSLGRRSLQPAVSPAPTADDYAQ